MPLFIYIYCIYIYYIFVIKISDNRSVFYLHRSSQSSLRAPPWPRSLSAAPIIPHRSSAVGKPQPNWSPSPVLGPQRTSPPCQTSWRSPWWRQRLTPAQSPWWWTPPATAGPWGRPWRCRPCPAPWTRDSSSAAPGLPCITRTPSPRSSAACRASPHRGAKKTWRSSRWDVTWSIEYSGNKLITRSFIQTNLIIIP